MRENGLFYRMAEIRKDAIYFLSERLIEIYEEINTIVFHLMDEAEDQCSTLNTASIP